MWYKLELGRHDLSNMRVFQDFRGFSGFPETLKCRGEQILGNENEGISTQECRVRKRRLKTGYAAKCLLDGRKGEEKRRVRDSEAGQLKGIFEFTIRTVVRAPAAQNDSQGGPWKLPVRCPVSLLMMAVEHHVLNLDGKSWSETRPTGASQRLKWSSKLVECGPGHR